MLNNIEVSGRKDNSQSEMDLDFITCSILKEDVSSLFIVLFCILVNH